MIPDAYRLPSLKRSSNNAWILRCSSKHILETYIYFTSSFDVASKVYRKQSAACFEKEAEVTLRMSFLSP